MQSKVFLLSFWLLNFCFNSTARAQDYIKTSQSQFLFGTIMAIDVCSVDGRQDEVRSLLDMVWQRLKEIEVRTDAGNPQSDVAAINASGGAAVMVNAEIYQLIKSLRDVILKSDGMFDITIKSLSDLWQRAANENKYPSLGDIAEAKEHIGIDKIELKSDGSVRLADPYSRIDLGSVSHGFAVDEAVTILRQARFFNFLIRAGSTIYAAGTNCHGQAWRLVIKDPDRQDKVMDAIELGDAALSSTGDNDQAFVIQGKTWSRHLNPMTGYPQNGVAGATVIAPTATAARALSLAMCILGPVQGVNLVEQMGDGYAALMLFRREGRNYEWFSTSGYDDRRVAQTE